MGEVWKNYQLGDLLESITGGGTPSTSKPEYWNGNIPWASVKDMQVGKYSLDKTEDYITEMGLKNSSTNLIEAGTVITSTRMGLGRCFINKVDMAINQDLKALKPKEETLDKSFLLWLLISKAEEIEALGTGTTVKGIRLEELKGLQVKIPSFAEQKRIVDILNTYTKSIENNTRRITILETMAQNLYREWFVNFRFPGHEQSQWQDTPQGKTPAGWEAKRLDDFVVLQRGFDLPKSKRNEDGNIPIYAASGINGFHDEAKAKPPGLVTGRSGTLGIVNLVLEDYWPLNTSLWVKEFKGCSAYYAYYLLGSIGLERFNSGASVPTLNRNDIHGLEVIAPPADLIEQFENNSKIIHGFIKNLTNKNKNLRQQRDILLPKLIGG